MNIAIALAVLATVNADDLPPVPRTELEPEREPDQDLVIFDPPNWPEYPETPVWNEPPVRTGRRAKRDPHGRLDRRDYAKSRGGSSR